MLSVDDLIIKNGPIKATVTGVHQRADRWLHLLPLVFFHLLQHNQATIWHFVHYAAHLTSGTHRFAHYLARTRIQGGGMANNQQVVSVGCVTQSIFNHQRVATIKLANILVHTVFKGGHRHIGYIVDVNVKAVPLE